MLAIGMYRSSRLESGSGFYVDDGGGSLLDRGPENCESSMLGMHPGFVGRAT